jgi:hypothetical protein
MSSKYEEFIDTLKTQLKVKSAENAVLKDQLNQEQEKAHKLTREFAKEVEGVI